jgi:hypothetical protein
MRQQDTTRKSLTIFLKSASSGDLDIHNGTVAGDYSSPNLVPRKSAISEPVNIGYHLVCYYL